MSNIIWHNRFENDWMRAFPLGNGRIGAMVYGNPEKETIEINEESLWSGRQLTETFESSPEALSEIRSLLFEEKFEEAAEICSKTFLASPQRVRFYESFGEIFIDFDDKGEYSDYRKELDLGDAVARVSYKKGNASYMSESFVSEEYDFFVYKITASKPFSCNVTMKRAQDAATSAICDDTIVLNGTVTYKTDPFYGEGGEGMSFGSRIYIKTDGILSSDKASITVTDGTYIIIYAAFETNYNVQKFDIDETIDYKHKLIDKITAVKSADFEKIKKEHIRSHKKLYEKNRLWLDCKNFDSIPTDERLNRIKQGFTDDLGLYVLYYNFGRYLLIESSGKRATLPANLQGIWCNGFTPPWGSDYHTNINLQMNYWPAEPANMTEAMNPFIHFMKMISSFGRSTAKDLFGCGGWAINHTTDIFGRCGVHDSVQCGFFPMAGPWLCLNLWEHYEFTNDIDFLKEIYPVLKGACEFVKDFLIEKDGYLITNPSNSPENKFYYITDNGDKKSSMFTYGATIDFEIIHALFTRTVHACKSLALDTEFSETLEKILSKLPPLKISRRYGTICEWIKDYEETEPAHRHISHLFGLFPGDQINETDEEIYQAAKNTIARRLNHGGGATGWSRAWIINFYARLKDGENAFNHLYHLMKLSTAENLFDMHPPFQIDGNFGAVSGISEMLVQSHLGTPDERITEILPALPAEWKNGKLDGVKVRGSFGLNIEWKNNTPAKLTVTSNSRNTFRLKLSDSMKNITAEKEYCIKNNILEMNLDKNEKQEIIFCS